MLRLNSKWFLGFQGTAEERKKHEEVIRHSRTALDQLTKVIRAEIKELEANNVSDYEVGNWAYLQADRNGALRALRNLLKMVDLTHSLEGDA